MPAKYSTGLRNAMLAGAGLKAALEADDMKMRLYSGPVPATADAALGSAVLRNTISDDASGAGLEFDAAAVASVLPKDPAQIWRGLYTADATLTFYRIEEDTDDGTLSTTRKRIQGTLGTAGADLNLSSVNVLNGASQTINHYAVNLPTN